MKIVWTVMSMQVSEPSVVCSCLGVFSISEGISVIGFQHEVGKRNLEILEASTDARGRKLEVYKVHVPPPLFRTYKEAEGVDVKSLSPLSFTCQALVMHLLVKGAADPCSCPTLRHGMFGMNIDIMLQCLRC